MAIVSLLTTLALLPIGYPLTGATKFMSVLTQFVAADPGMLSASMNHGTGASKWGIWRKDPGPRGVRFSKHNPTALNNLMSAKTAPAGWKFDADEWWLEEHGLVMEKPDFPLPSGSYKLDWLNGASRRGDSIVLTIDGDSWKLDGDHTLHDVTHLPCRSAAYTGCSPKSIDMNNFPVTPGACMPEVTGCRKTDYAVLFVNAIEDPGANFSPKSRAALKNAIGSCV